MEWLYQPMPKRLSGGVPIPDTRRGIPNSRIICYEGDPRCDFDPDLNNNSCTMRTALCINNSDPRLTRCTPSNLASVEVRRPNPAARRSDAADAVNLATLEALAGGGPGGFGVTVLRRDGSVPFTGSPNSSPNQCSAPVDLLVPQVLSSRGTYVRGIKKISLVGRTSDPTRRNRDVDSLLLLCKVSSCGNNVIETTHETCDDGNRVNGDGCNQACQIETGPTATPTATVPTATPTITPTAGPPTDTPTAAPPTNTPTVAPPTNTPIPGAPTNTPTHSPGPATTPTATAAATATPDDGSIPIVLLPGGGSPGSCRSNVCVGGPYDGLACTVPGDCNGCNPNDICTAAGTPFACCSAANAGTCPVVGSCALVQNPLFAVRVPLNGICVPRTSPDTACLTDVECAAGSTCQLSRFNILVGTPDANQETPITVPQGSVLLSPAIVSGIGTVCVPFAADGVGFHDCNGGRANRDATVSVDHNTTPNGCLGGTNEGGACTSSADCPAGTFATCSPTTNTCLGGKNFFQPCNDDTDCPNFDAKCNLDNSGSANGLPDDPECNDNNTLPDGSTSFACEELTKQCSAGSNEGLVCENAVPDCNGEDCTLCNADSPHAQICNSPTESVLSGTFGAGDLVISAPLEISILDTAANFGPDGLPCTADDTPADPSAPVQVQLGTGTNRVFVFDAGNSNGAVIGPGETCGATPCFAEINGTPISCADLTAGNVSGLKFGGGFPAVDTTAGDIATVFQFVAK
jgi:cysteine-rich repeat protein